MSLSQQYNHDINCDAGNNKKNNDTEQIKPKINKKKKGRSGKRQRKQNSNNNNNSINSIKGFEGCQISATTITKENDRISMGTTTLYAEKEKEKEKEKEENNDDDQDQDQDQDDIIKFSTIQDLIKQTGARFSGIVHKKLDFLIATRGAIQSGTQRVRKAIKLNRPIVKPIYIQDCVLQGKRIDFNNNNNNSKYLYDIDMIQVYLNDLEKKRMKMKTQQEEDDDNKIKEEEEDGDEEEKVEMGSNNNKKKKKKEKKKEKEEKEKKILTVVADGDYKERIIDLGCCCSCHDDGKISCSWCVQYH